MFQVLIPPPLGRLNKLTDPFAAQTVLDMPMLSDLLDHSQSGAAVNVLNVTIGTAQDGKPAAYFQGAITSQLTISSTYNSIFTFTGDYTVECEYFPVNTGVSQALFCKRTDSSIQRWLEAEIQSNASMHSIGAYSTSG